MRLSPWRSSLARLVRSLLDFEDIEGNAARILGVEDGIRWCGISGSIDLALRLAVTLSVHVCSGVDLDPG